MTPANDHDRKVGPGLGHTVWMLTEVDRFQRRFQRQAVIGAPLPLCTWGQLERQLQNLATSEALRAAIPELIISIRKQSRWLPNEMVLREILCAAFAVMECDVTMTDSADLHRA